MTPYHEALRWIRQHPGTGAATSLAKLVLSLWNDECAFSLRECLGNLDAVRTDLALRLVTYFAERGEDHALVEVGHAVCADYPKLWELGQAADAAKQTLRKAWDRDAAGAAEG